MKLLKEISTTELQKNTFEMIGKDWMLVTAGTEEKANTMTASWGGLGVMFQKDVAYIVVRPQRYTKDFIDQEGTFSLSFFDNSYKKILGYLGSVSGRDEDKITKSGLTLAFCEGTPYFDEAETIFICKKMVRQPLDRTSILEEDLDKTFYPDQDYHILYIAEITKILVTA